MPVLIVVSVLLSILETDLPEIPGQYVNLWSSVVVILTSSAIIIGISAEAVQGERRPTGFPKKMMHSKRMK